MNPVLEKTKAEILGKVDQRLHPAIEKAVKGGQTLMYAQETREQLVESLGDGSDPESIGSGIAKLLAVLFNKSNNTLPLEVGVPAAVLLLCEALQFIEDSGKAQITPEMLAECVKAMGSAVLQMFGVTPEKMQSMMQQGGAQ